MANANAPSASQLNVSFAKDKLLWLDNPHYYEVMLWYIIIISERRVTLEILIGCSDRKVTWDDLPIIVKHLSAGIVCQ